MRTVVLSMALVAFGCAHKAAEPAKATAAAGTAAEAPKKPLYDRLGGRPAIIAVVDRLRRPRRRRQAHQRCGSSTPTSRTSRPARRVRVHGDRRPVQVQRARHGDVARRHGARRRGVQRARRGSRRRARQVQGAGEGEGRAARRARPAQAADRESADRSKPIDDAQLAKAHAGSRPTAQDRQDRAPICSTWRRSPRKRGQRNYADQLFTPRRDDRRPPGGRSIAAVFREGAPPRITTTLKQMPKDTAPQPKGSSADSDEDEPDKKPARGSLTGVMTVDGKPLDGRSASSCCSRRPASGEAHPEAARHRAARQAVRAARDGGAGRLDRVVPELRSRSSTTCSRCRRPSRSTSACTRTARPAR